MQRPAPWRLPLQVLHRPSLMHLAAHPCHPLRVCTKAGASGGRAKSGATRPPRAVAGTTVGSVGGADKSPAQAQRGRRPPSGSSPAPAARPRGGSNSSMEIGVVTGAATATEAATEAEVGMALGAAEGLHHSASLPDIAPHRAVTQWDAPLPPPPRGGTAVISEFSTCSHVLSSAYIVNPWNIKAVCEEIDKVPTGLQCCVCGTCVTPGCWFPLAALSPSTGSAAD